MSHSPDIKEVPWYKEKTNQPIPILVNRSKSFEWPEDLQIESITFLESAENHMISFLRKLVVSPDGELLYIFDSRQQKMLVFDKSGKAVRVFDRQGEGPEEYLEMTELQIDFEKGIFELMDYQKIKKYDLNTFDYISTENLGHLPRDKNFRNFVRIDDVLYLWTNLPPNQRVGPEDLGEHHLVRVQDGQVSYFVEKQYGVINGQVFYPSPTKNKYNLPPVVGSTDLLTVTKDSVYVKHSLDYGNRGVPKFELENYWERQDEIFNSNYYKPAQNIRETKNHLYFEFAGNRSEYHFTLLDKRTNSIQSIGKPSKRLNPAIIYSDAEYFYAYRYQHLL